MDKLIEVSASILCADFLNLKEEIKVCEDAGVDSLHVDVMDGHFVPNITLGQMFVQAIKTVTKMPIETHLMIENPWTYIDEFIDAGSDSLYLHVECYGVRINGSGQYGVYPKEIDSVDEAKLLADISRIQDKGSKACLVFSPDTELCGKSVLDKIDGLLIMAVNPGFAKQKFMPDMLRKIEKLVAEGFSGDIAIDGGINAETAPSAVKAGANILATASYFFGANDKEKAVSFLKGLPRA